MSTLNFEQMQAMQIELQKKYKEQWGGLSPEKAREKLLWMIAEAGEIADIIKKQGDNKIMFDRDARGAFIEEICDVLMYLNDIMLCYSITPAEFEQTYLQKHSKNMKRW